MRCINRTLRFAAFIFFLSGLLNLFQHLSAQQSIRIHQLISGKKEIKIQAIAQDHSGNLWVGTELGLIRYNGISYKLFQRKDGLSSNSVTALLENSDSILWIGYADGKISLLRNEKFSSFTQKDSADKEKISCIVADSKKNVWIGTYGSGTYLFDGKNISHYNSKNGLSDDFVYSICEAKEGSIWLGTDGGITILEGGKKNYLTTKSGLPDNIVPIILKDRKGKIWIAMRDSGFCNYDLAEKKIIRPGIKGGWKFGPIYSMLVDYSGAVWIGAEAEGGLIAFTVRDNYYFRFPVSGHNAHSNQKVQVLFEDTEKNIWIGTEKGLTQYCRSRFEVFTMKDGLPSDSIRALMNDSKGNYWISTPKGLFTFHFDESGIPKSKLFFSDKKSDFRIVSLFEGKNGNVWVGTYGHGAYLLNPETGSTTIFSEAQGLASNNIMSICDDKDGNIWLATLGGGVSKISFTEENYRGKSAVKNFSEEDGIGSIYAYYAFRDSRNILWFGTDGGGITRYDGKFFSSFNTKAGGLKSDIVYSIIEDESGLIWFATQEGGIYSYNGRTFTNYGTENGIRDLSPDILSLGAGNDVVIAHDNGIDVLDGKNPKQARQYNFSEAGNDFSPNQNVFFRDKNGIVWMGTDNGIIRFRSSFDSLDYLAPKTQLTGLQVMLQLYPMNASPEFSYKQNQFVFEFMGTFLRAPEKVRYRYKLDGHNKEWSLPTENRMASYPNLPNGEYTFQVSASNAEGMWSEPVSYHFVIKPPFWKTVWFYLLCAIFLAAFFYVSMKLRVKALQRQNKILEEKVEQRTHEVVEQKKIIEEKNKDITSSIRYAKRIQDALLPAKKYMDEHMEDYFVLFKQKDIVSGDFYWANKKESKLFFAAIDCTGHGVPGAFVSLVAHGNIQRAIIMFQLRTPSEILDKLNEGVTDVLSRGGETQDIKDGMDISLCGLDRKNMKLEFSGANHPMLLIRNGELKEIRGDKQPIGQFISRKNFTNHELEIQKGDTIYLYSDGYGDQFGGKQGKKFKRSRLKELILSIHHKPMEQQKIILDETIEEWKGNLEQIDDILVMGVKV
ncbi:MAG: SpoIIE family protein phosphatase [Bacteroidetes bacterium]|nr:SpoIIE family protein phosphatase [Bacteroidota bacterium]